MLPKRDSHDQRIISEVRSGRTTFGDGIVSSQFDVGGWPVLNSAPAPADSDADGMPDNWERSFNPNHDLSWTSASDADGDGYTNIEEFLITPTPIRSEHGLSIVLTAKLEIDLGCRHRIMQFTPLFQGLQNSQFDKFLVYRSRYVV